MTVTAFEPQLASFPGRNVAGFAPRAKSYIQPNQRRAAVRHFNKFVSPQKRKAALERRATEEFQAHNEGFEYAVSRITELLNDGLTQPVTALRFLRVLKRIQGPEHVYPHISADDEGELIAFWSAGKMSIEMSVPAEGDAYLRITNVDGHEVTVSFVPWLPITEIRTQLSALSRLVVSSNPRWRAIFVS